MKLTPGTIYFVREQDSTLPALTGLVKIGLVSGDRSPYVRLREHQTGNPRKLLFDPSQFVQTQAVEYVESQLHGRFAAKRVSGEWFSFANQTELDQVVQSARDMAKQLESSSSIFEKAAGYRFSYSNGEVAPKSAAATEIANRYVNANAVCERAEGLIEKVAAGIRWQAEALGEAAVEGIMQVIRIAREPAFSVEKFKKAHPKIWEEFCDIVPQAWNPKFLIQHVAELSVETQNVLAVLDDMDDHLDQMLSKNDVYGLNEIDLGARQLLAPATWDRDMAEAELQNMCGNFEAIESICAWKREVVTRRSFNIERLREANPALHESFTFSRPDEVKRVRLPFQTTGSLENTKNPNLKNL